MNFEKCGSTVTSLYSLASSGTFDAPAAAVLKHPSIHSRAGVVVNVCASDEHCCQLQGTRLSTINPMAAQLLHNPVATVTTQTGTHSDKLSGLLQCDMSMKHFPHPPHCCSASAEFALPHIQIQCHVGVPAAPDLPKTTTRCAKQNSRLEDSAHESHRRVRRQ